MKHETMEILSDNRMEAYEVRREQVQCFHLTSDLFFSKVLEDIAACQEVAQILLNRPEFTVKAVKAQYSIRNMENRSMTLDILAEDVEGHLVNIEMQIGENEDHQKRVRYYQTDLFPNVVKKVQFYKEKKEGIEIMCRILDAERTKGIEEGMKEGLKANRINELNRRLLSDGRKEDIMTALANSEYQAMLLRKYEL